MGEVTREKSVAELFEFSVPRKLFTRTPPLHVEIYMRSSSTSGASASGVAATTNPISVGAGAAGGGAPVIHECQDGSGAG